MEFTDSSKLSTLRMCLAEALGCCILPLALNWGQDNSQYTVAIALFTCLSLFSHLHSLEHDRQSIKMHFCLNHPFTLDQMTARTCCRYYTITRTVSITDVNGVDVSTNRRRK